VIVACLDPRILILQSKVVVWDSLIGAFCLKGQCHEKFLASGYFNESSSLKPLKITIGSFKYFFLNSRRYSQAKVHLVHRYQQHWCQICHQCHWCYWYRWQIIGTISDCWHLKMNLKEKIVLYVNSTTQRFPKKIRETFQIEDFFYLPSASLKSKISRHCPFKQ
jgi:hypothetical protein